MSTIINNTAVSDEANLRIENPYIYVADPDKGKPLAGASLYFGLPDFDPENPEFQKRVYVIQEDGSAIPIDQPVTTGAGGVPEYEGSPAMLAIDGDYSWKVLSSQGEQKYYAPYVKNLNSLSAGLSTVIEDRITLADGQTSVVFPRADLSVSTVDVRGLDTDNGPLYRDDGYYVVNGSTGEITLDKSYPAGTVIRARQNASTAQDEGDLIGVSKLYVFPTRNGAEEADLQIGDACMIFGSTTVSDGLGGDRYEVVAGGTGPNDGVNFISINNGNQLRLADGLYKFKTFTESVAQAQVTSGTLFIDLDEGTVHEVTLTENISSISFANVNDFAGLSSTVTIKIKQDGTGSRSVNFVGIKFAGGVAPTLSTDPDAEDILVFTTFDGSSFYGFLSGADFS